MKRYVLAGLLFFAALNVRAQTGTSSGDSLKFALAKKQLSIFFTAFDAAGLNYIANSTPYTIFAPDNEAFAKLPAGILDSLLKPANKPALINFLNNHIIPGKLTSKDIAKLLHDNKGAIILTTRSGTKLNAALNANRNIALIDEMGNESIVKQFDIADGNAEIFVISSVILPKK